MQKFNLKKLLLIIPLMLVLLSCTKKEETDFSDGGVSFKVPAGWSIAEFKKEEAYIVNVKKDGLLSGSVFIAIWYETGLLTPETMINAMVNEMKNNSILEHSEMTFGEIYDDKFTGNNAKALDYTVELLNAVSKGKIYSYIFNGRTYCIMQQGVDDESVEDAVAFKRIEQTFSTEILEETAY